MAAPDIERSIARTVLYDCSLGSYLEKEERPTRPLCFVRPSDKIYEALAKLSHANVLSAPVVDPVTRAVSGARKMWGGKE